MLCRPLRLYTNGDQKLKPRSSEKKSNEFLAEETKGRDPPRHNGFKAFFNSVLERKAHNYIQKC